MARAMSFATVGAYLNYLNSLIYKDPTVEISVIEVIDALTSISVYEPEIIIDGDAFRKYFGKRNP
jgi:hypothetical protein